MPNLRTMSDRLEEHLGMILLLAEIKHVAAKGKDKAHVAALMSQMINELSLQPVVVPIKPFSDRGD
jgi:hypothetical protein